MVTIKAGGAWSDIPLCPACFAESHIRSVVS